MASVKVPSHTFRLGDEVQLSYRTDDAVRAHPLVPVDIDIINALADIDRKALRAYRLKRIREQLKQHDYAGILLADPLNIRYATDTLSLGVWVMHSPSRYVYIATEGPVVLFDFTSSKHNSEHVETIDEIRPTTPWIYFLVGPRVDEKAEIWAQQMADLIKEHGGSNTRVAVDRCDPWGADRLKAKGISLFDAQPLMEQARLIKSAEEIASHRVSMAVCDLGVARMRQNLRPGITENQLWSIMHSTNVAHGGEWAEARLLTSGQRTNPWFQDATDKVIEAGEIVGFDTDMIGPGGYLSDISRSFICPGKAPTAYQRSLLQTASDQLCHNIDLIRPGLTYREFAERCWPVPKKFEHNRYMMMVHGCGLADEYPSVAYAVDFDEWGYDGVFQENMVISVESYIGEQGAAEGVKLEEQLLITAEGAVKLSSTPLMDLPE